MKLTLYHDGQFWVGVAEDVIDGKIKAVRHIFGSEPQDEEMLAFVNQQLMWLFNFTSATVPVSKLVTKKANTKRLAREAAREVRSAGVSSYAQQAIQLELEQRKKSRQTISKKQKELEAQQKWQLKRQKAKEKHRGH